MKHLFSLLLTASILSACLPSAENAKDAIKGGGEIVGKTVGEFGKGVSEGIEETFQMKVSLSEALTEQGIELGKVTLESDSGGSDNVLVLYMIFKDDFSATVSAKVYDMNELEMGRSSLDIDAKSGDAIFHEFLFNKRTNIDSDSKVVVE